VWLIPGVNVREVPGDGRVWAAMVAAVRVSSPQKLWAPWRASSIRSVISPRLASTRLRHLLCGEGGAVEPLVREQVTRRRPGLQQVSGHLALVHRVVPLTIHPWAISPGG
jgi:hypothetical protein